MRTLLAALLIVIPVAAIAKPQLSAEQKKTYAAKLREGRKLVEKKDYAKAIVALEAALAVNKDEPAALAELGLAAYFVKDYKKAEEATRKAIANTTIPWVLGAANFNLGLILEAKGDKAGAIAAYSASLDARGSEIVRARLAKLDAKADALAIWYEPAKLKGPFKTAEAACASLPADDGVGHKCTCTPQVAAKPAAPFLGLGVASQDCPGPGTDNGGAVRSLLVQTAAGWFVDEPQDYFYNLWCNESFDIKHVATSQLVPGGTLELAFTVDQNSSCDGRAAINVMSERTTHYFVGLGASGQPSLMSVLGIDREIQEYDAAYGSEDPADKQFKRKVTVARQVVPKWDAGKLTLTGKGLDKARGETVPHEIIFK